MSSVTRSGAYGRSPDRIELRGPLMAMVVAPVQFMVAWMASSSVMAFVGLVGLVAASVAVLVWPTALMVLSFPASFGVRRVGPAAIDMSLADFTAALAAVAALPYVPWQSKAFRSVLKAMLAYSALISVSVFANPSLTGAIEVGHRFVMVMGAVCVGAAVVHRRKVTAALRALLLFATYFSIVSIVDAISSGFEPTYSMGIPKNAGGTLLCTTFIALFFGHRYVRWRLWITVPMGAVILGGMAATQSRGSITGLMAAAVIYLVVNLWKRRSHRVTKVFLYFLVVAVPLTWVGVTTYQKQADERIGDEYKFSSAGSREANFRSVWSTVIVPQPLTGAGPKWFNRPGARAGEPHNVVLSELASVGALGFVGFIAVIAVCLRWTRPNATVLGELAFYALLARVIAGLFDIFWVAGPNTLPFLMLGLGIGATAAIERSHDPVQTPVAAR